ncbi:hypothetical protein L596_017310 [Steinernema carpocapsae]|uniref:Uncharacterized protein n=1 Tax=Steinernema carpocapsae TaxID=34508 RepID=A0A4U5N1I6_STECR|nr:hypothetical protein L596_017310 [Steinernema carpocapsae]
MARKKKPIGSPARPIVLDDDGPPSSSMPPPPLLPALQKTNLHRIFNGDRKDNKVLVVGDQPFHIYGAFRVQCVYGTANINGVELEAAQFHEDRWVDACFPYNMGLAGIIAKVIDPLEKPPNMQRLKWRIEDFSKTAKDEFDSIVKVYNPGDAVICVEGRMEDPIFRAFVECVGYYSLVPVLSNLGKVVNTYAIYGKPLPPLYDEQTEGCIDAWDRLIRESEGKTRVTVVVGNKGVGKSTLVRYLTNLRRNCQPHNTYILDLDMGQPLFSPPGSIGLFKADIPLLGASFAMQLLEYDDSLYCGTIDMSNIEPQDYGLRVEQLMKEFRSYGAGNHLIVNTPGWVEDMGASYVQKVLDIVEPTFMFNLLSRRFGNYEPRESDLAAISHVYAPIMTRDLGDQFTDGRMPPLTASEMRYLQSAAYMISLGYEFFKMRPFSVGFNKVALYLPQGTTCMGDEMYLGAFNEVFVALCVSDKKDLPHLMNDANMPRRLLYEGKPEELRCIGYGLVRAIDVETKKFYVLTPVSLESLKFVNVIARCEEINLTRNYMAMQAHKEAPYWIWRQQSEQGPMKTMNTEAHMTMYNKVEFVSMEKRYFKDRKRARMEH